jgi:bacterioferritin-associated ferredoxin
MINSNKHIRYINNLLGVMIMDIIEVCTYCGSLGIEVEPITVKSMLKDNLKPEFKDNAKWYICSSENCDKVYFSNDKNYSKKDVRVLIWYKEHTDEVPICYCSNLTEKEIFNAVKNGCETIDDVQEYTNKNITGKCKTENPLGKCCRNVFLKAMENAKK